MADKLSRQLRIVGENLGRPIVQRLILFGVTANHLTMMGMIGGILGATVIWFGPWWEASIIFLLAGACDALDGQVARARGQANAVGGYTDSVMDRVTDIVIHLSLLGWYAWNHFWFTAVAAGVATLVAVLVPYIRAKAEALQARGDDGLLTRAPRTVLLIAGLAAGPVATSFVLTMIAVLGTITVIQRYQAVRRQLLSPPLP